MLILEATGTLVDDGPDDFNWCREGELVYLGFQECRSSTTCGCDRSFNGFDSHRATSTARVAERPDLTIEQLARELAASLHAGGWIPSSDPGHELVGWLATEIVDTANGYARFGIGTLVTRSGDDLQLRPSAEPV